ncbi:hypothetical protein N1851_021878 [Merluccius polli]|uniref:Uncharacterized protein n=1 Tax=Merluccius polli TaxID=89951 RepID=A0AA47MJE1_MERPO|nr:hypothetical protein N1851_021878 [Merluccius polli]
MKLFALFCLSALLLHLACHVVEGHGVFGRVTLSRELLLSFQSSTAGATPATVPIELRRLAKKPSHRKRRRRGCIQRRLKTLRPAVQSIRHKIDELETYTKFKREVKDTCLLAFTKTWLGDTDQNSDLILTGFGSSICMDRSREITGKSRGGGVCFYVNQAYCNTVVIREKICTTDMELLSISLRPFYLPREFQQFPSARRHLSLSLCNLKKALGTYEQYVTCPTTHKNTILDLCYGSVSGAYKSLPMTSFGASYHSSVYLMPVYKRSFRCLEQEERTVKIWSETSISSLQACFECTDWDCFYDGCDYINDISDTISSYITFCVDLVIPTKKVVIYPNNKPWVTKKLKAVINNKKIIFYSGDTLAKKTHFTSLFLMCVESGQIPTIWKTSTIIPVPKNNNPRELNEFKPVALTSLVMKVLEKIFICEWQHVLRHHLKYRFSTGLYPFAFVIYYVHSQL